MAKNILPSEWSVARRRFIEAGGHTTQSFGLGRIIGAVLMVGGIVLVAMF